ncbi:MAG TPA: UrcA family protein [Steroidobacteraceae bacterium]|nr:UrcA family protein [Steroidobacteraceae bacterium]
MNTILGKVVIGVASAMSLSSAAIAQDVPEVTVQAKRLLNTKVTERIEGGLPLQDISVSYGVRTWDLDLATHSGATVLEQRVKDAAKLACKEISRQFPDASPSETKCATTEHDGASPWAVLAATPAQSGCVLA